jgi:murein L,D-transpeptidase YcbB/YkuD
MLQIGLCFVVNLQRQLLSAPISSMADGAEHGGMRQCKSIELGCVMSAWRLGSVFAVLLGVSGAVTPALAQERVAALMSAPSPKLEFSPAQMDLAQEVSDDSDLAAFYGRNGLSPLFIGPSAEERRKAVRSAIQSMPRHGIPVSRYTPESLPENPRSVADEVAYARRAASLLRDLSGGILNPASVDPEIKRVAKYTPVGEMLAKFQTATDPAAVLSDAAPHSAAYLALQNALFGPEQLKAPQNLPRAPEAVWHVGEKGAGVVPLRDRLTAVGFPTDTSDKSLYDAALSNAVASYQRAAGLRADGIAGPQTIRLLNGDMPSGQGARQRAILVAMERLRWMGSQDLGERYVWVNIPEFSTTIIENGDEVFRTRSVVGKNGEHMQTPEFSDVMSNVVVNPSWNVPRSITTREYLPKLQANPNAVSHLELVDGRGNVVSRSGINFNNYNAGNFPFRLREKPSEDNALGIVKFIFPNQWNIYLHDTPSKHLFANANRAYSHGCVRIGDPRDLAQALLSKQTDDPAGMFQRTLDSGRETWLTLRPKVPVHLVYFTAWPDQSGNVRLYDDVYGRDAKVWDALQAQGMGQDGAAS